MTGVPAYRYFTGGLVGGKTGYWRTDASAPAGRQVTYLWPDGTWRGSTAHSTEAAVVASGKREISAEEVPHA